MIAIIILFQWTTFANTDDMNLLWEAAHFIVSFVSWWWVILAMLAGKLMTNEFVYWSFMHLDVYLRKLWNVMKNFANFALWFAFLFSILKSIFITKKDWKNIIVKFLLAWVLVQASWFIIGAVMDISTIATTAIASFPAQFMAWDTSFATSMKDTYKQFWYKHIINLEGKEWVPVLRKELIDPTKDWFTSDEIDNITDLILPSYNTVSWPLLFLGFSIFDFSTFPDPKALEGQTDTDFWWLLVYLGINWLIVILFTIALLLLFIINVVRVAMLRVMIPLSPLIILASLFFKDQMGKMSWLKRFNIKTVIGLLFKPVIFVAYLSLIFIFTVGVFSILKPNDTTSVEFADQGVTVSSSKASSSFEVEWLVDFTLNGAKTTISWIIVYLFALFMMWYLVKIAAKNWTGIEAVDKQLTKLTDSVWEIAGNVWVVPIPTWNGGMMVGTNAISDISKRMANPSFITQTKASQEAELHSLFWWGKDWDTLYDDQLKKAILDAPTNPEAFWWVTNNIASNLKWWVSLSDGVWWSHFAERLKKKPKVKVNWVEQILNYSSSDSIETYFKKTTDWGNDAFEYVKSQLQKFTPTAITKDNIMSIKFGRYAWVKSK